jgi:CRISPR-associated protein Cas1
MTMELQVKLAENQVAVILCDAKHLPVSMNVAFEGHHQHAKILKQQIEVSEPTKKRLWQTIIQGKIQNQAEALRQANLIIAKKEITQLQELQSFVRSGDPDNIEGQAARKYWPLLFGHGFLRDRDEPGVNVCLNYGYAVVRAAMARALVGTGLHPALGIHHRNAYNAFALADDVMEPLRPMVDVKVAKLVAGYQSKGAPFPETLNPSLKRDILTIVTDRLDFANTSTSFMITLPIYAAYFKQALCRDKKNLIVPAFATGADTGSCG